MHPAEAIEKHHDKILELARKAGAYNVRVFGSTARGDAKATSDLDLLVDIKPTVDLLDLAGLELDLNDLLGCKVQVVTERSLSKYLRDSIIREARPL